MLYYTNIWNSPPIIYGHIVHCSHFNISFLPLYRNLCALITRNCITKSRKKGYASYRLTWKNAYASCSPVHSEYFYTKVSLRECIRETRQFECDFYILQRYCFAIRWYYFFASISHPLLFRVKNDIMAYSRFFMKSN